MEYFHSDNCLSKLRRIKEPNTEPCCTPACAGAMLKTDHSVKLIGVYYGESFVITWED